MKNNFKLKIGLLVVLVCIGSILAQRASAASLLSASDTLSTSTPSTASNPIKSMHTITFKTIGEVPASGKIVISFPLLASSDTNNPASASASTFQLNGLSDSQVKINGLSGAQTFAGTYTNPTAGTSPTITLALSGTTTIPAGTTVTILLGSPSPLIINPTKKSAWRISIKTRTSSNTDIDETSVQVATVPSIKVQAKVEETFTVTIDGISDKTAVNAGNQGCSNLETTNTGYASSARSVNLGMLQYVSSSARTKIGNLTAQIISVTTNAYNGYAITATSSGHLTNISTGFAIGDNTTPSAFPSGQNWFGIHPCGLDVSLSTWVTGTDQNCNSTITGSQGNICKYAWPNISSPFTLASDSTGPIGNNLTPGNGVTTIQYAAGIDKSVPGGNYSTTIRYTITPTF